MRVKQAIRHSLREADSKIALSWILRNLSARNDPLSDHSVWSTVINDLSLTLAR
jgi:hypothetical protein